MNVTEDIAELSRLTEFSIRDLNACFSAIKTDQGCDDAVALDWLTEAVWMAVKLGVHIISVSAILNTVLMRVEANNKKIPIYGWN